jgi:hypothetical protein
MDHNQNPDHIAPDLIDDAIAPVRGEFACTSDHARWPSIPEHGKGAGLVLPLCNTETMTRLEHRVLKLSLLSAWYAGAKNPSHNIFCGVACG